MCYNFNARWWNINWIFAFTFIIKYIIEKAITPFNNDSKNTVIPINISVVNRISTPLIIINLSGIIIYVISETVTIISKLDNTIDIIKNPIKCTSCGGFLIKKNGTYGEFYGCTNYPFCHETMNIEK